jgi:hypothetical protein
MFFAKIHNDGDKYGTEIQIPSGIGEKDDAVVFLSNKLKDEGTSYARFTIYECIKIHTYSKNEAEGMIDKNKRYKQYLKLKEEFEPKANL